MEKDKVFWYKVIIGVVLFLGAFMTAYFYGLTPCKVAISMSPQIEFCQKPASETIFFPVKSNLAWQDTGVYVRPGQTIIISASGSVNTWGDNPIGYTSDPNGQTQNQRCPSEGNQPDCLINGELYGTLIGKIGGGAPFTVGTGRDIPITSNGSFYLAINDDTPYLNDNTGEYGVSITVK